MDILVLVEFLINLSDLQKDLKNFSVFILMKILIPCAIWRAGKPQIKIRKAAIINIMSLISQELIDPEILHQVFNAFSPKILF